MSDALSRNGSKLENIIKCYCLSHAFRKYEELIPFYEVPCLKVTDLISDIYKINHQIELMSDEDRLKYHQVHCVPILDKLHHYLNELINTIVKEPSAWLPWNFKAHNNFETLKAA